ncbi:conserved protein of unknown function [Tenacibaculum sp. 190524A02b]|uniref:hypothetical protein n=1 Tax=Tenacibaculum vairaonense TaxID=3137860 RepID=UPI0032B1DDB1
MELILNIFLFFVVLGLAISKIFKSLVPKEEESPYIDIDEYLSKQKSDSTIINNYTINIQNNLNVSEDEFKRLTKS